LILKSSNRKLITKVVALKYRKLLNEWTSKCCEAD